MTGEPWSDFVGFLPWKVTAREEPTRNGVVYLWWRQDGNWKKRSLRRGVRTSRGALDRELVKSAMREAEALYAKLVAGVPLDVRTPTAALTLGDTEALITDKDRGLYPADTPHRREVLRELRNAVEILGAATPWAAIKRDDLTALWRGRIRTLANEPRARTGVRGAEITVTRVLAIAAWLRDGEHIPAAACLAAKTWRKKLRDDWRAIRGEKADPQVHRPRHTLDEMRRVIAVSGQVDPRFELLIQLGAEIRLGQVARGRRRDLDLEHATFTVYSSAHKRGTVEKLTPGQMRIARAALETGYLRELEAHAADYPLFPQGQLAGSRPDQWKKTNGTERATKGPTSPTATVERHLNALPIVRRTILDWFYAAETLAEVPHVAGRGAYGVKRIAVDAAKDYGISREALKEHGGWTDTQMPDMIYADQERDSAREEAMRVRMRVRGEEEPSE